MESNVTIYIHNNLKPANGIKVHFVKQYTDHHKFLQMCSEVLKINSKRIFDAQGDEITRISLIEQNQDYYISQGEPFNHIDSQKLTQSNKQPKGQNVYPISILGQGSVGKSNVTMRWVKNQFYEYYDPTLQDDYTKKTTIDDSYCVVKVYNKGFYKQKQITDTCGQEDYVSLRTQWMKGREGLIFLYAINSADSFEDVRMSLALFRAQDQGGEQPVTLAVVGNKVDLEKERIIPTEEGRKLAGEYSALFFETSAKSGHNVETLFTELLRDIIYNREKASLRKREQLIQNQKNKRIESQSSDKSWFANSCCFI